MKIRLVNFGCWQDQTVEFSATGLNLLAGPSGIGKTSILRAFVWVLFGDGRNHVRKGASGCRVELTVSPTLHVVRESKPRRLVVNGTIEDDAAQAHINQVMGTGGDLLYVAQNAKNTFIDITPAKKLEFLNSITFDGDSSVSKLKTRLMERLKACDRRRMELDAHHQAISDRLKRTSVPQDDAAVAGNTQYTSIDDIVRAIEQLQSENQATLDRTNTLDAQLEVLRTGRRRWDSLQSELLHVSDKIHERLSELSRLTDERTRAECALNALDVDALRTELSRADAWTRRNTIVKLLQQCVQMRDTMLKERICDLHSQQHVCRTELTDMGTTRPQLQDELRAIDQRAQCMALINQFQQQLEGADSRAQEMDTVRVEATACQDKITFYNDQLGTVLQCPSCRVPLLFHDNVLHPTSINAADALTQDECRRKLAHYRKRLNTNTTRLLELDRQQCAHDTIQAQLEKAECELLLIPVVSDTRDAVSARYEQLCALHNKLQLIDRALDSTAHEFSQLDTQIATMTHTLSQLPDADEPQRDTDAVKADLAAHAVHQQRVTEWTQQIGRCTQQHAQLVHDADAVRAKLDTIGRDGPTLDTELLDVTQARVECQQRVANFAGQLQDLYAHATYRRSLAAFEELHTELNAVQVETNARTTELSTGHALQALMTTAEATALQVTLDMLNGLVQSYLDIFFPDEPMLARLVATPSSDDTKYKYEIDVDYRGLDLGMSMLSGGEYDRVVLAYALAIAELSDPPLLLLDECISSLDAETAEIVCEHLRETSKSRCTILIAHQIQTGMFERVVRVDELLRQV